MEPAFKPELPFLFNRTHVTARFYPKNYEQNNLPSQTIPNQTLPLREILTRYAKGQPIDGYIRQAQPDNGIGRDIRSLDISEQRTLLKAVKGEISELQAKLAQPVNPPPKPSQIASNDPTEALPTT